MTNPSGRRGRLTVILAVASGVASLAVGLAGAEIAVRYRERHRETVPGSIPISYPHERLRLGLIRNHSYYRWVRVNSQGFRGSREVGPKGANTLRIMAVGESTTFDTFVSGDSVTWPARLEFWLNARGPFCRVEVINAGVPGYRVLDNLIRLHTELLQYQPDVILLYHAHNDLFQTLLGGPVIADPNRPHEATYTSPLSRWLTRHSLFYAKLHSRSFMVRARATAADQSFQPGALERGVRQYQEELASFLTLAQARGVRVIVIQAVHVSGSGTLVEPDSAIRAEWSVSFPRIPTDTVLAAYDRFHRAARETAARFGADVIETRDFGLRGLEWYSLGDPIHFNDQGADRMAQRLAGAVAQRLLPDRRCATPVPSASAP